MATNTNTVTSEGAEHEIHNKLVMASAIQLGVDIARELLDTGNMVDEVKGEPVNITGIRNLMTATVVHSLAADKEGK